MTGTPRFQINSYHNYDALCNHKSDGDSDIIDIVTVVSGGDRGVMAIVVGNGHGNTKSKSWTRLIAFHIALIPLGKVWIQ